MQNNTPLTAPKPAHISDDAAYVTGQQSMLDAEIDLRRILMTFWRRRHMILIIMFLCIGMAYYASNKITPLYKSLTLVLVKQEKLDVGNISAAQFLLKERYDTTQILSEVEILRSRNVALDVIKRLKLYDDSEFNYGLKFIKTNKPLTPEKKDSKFKSLKLERDSLSPENQWEYEKELSILIGRFLKKLEVRPVPGSLVISIKYTSRSPQKAKMIADTVATVYVNQRLNQKFEATRKVNSWLDDRLETLRVQLREAEAAVETYRADKELITGARAEITAQQLSEVSTQLVLARTRLAEAQARLEQIKGWAENPLKIEATSTLTNGSVLNNLLLTQSNIAQRYADLSKRYGPKHPEMIRIEAEKQNIAHEVQQELRRMAEQLESNMAVEVSRTQVLSDNLKQLEDKRKNENQAMIKLRELEGEAETIRQIFETFLESYKKSDKQEDLQEADARVLSYAPIPLRPFYPNKPLMLSLSAILGLFFALGIIVLLENLDNAYRSAIQIEKDTGLYCVGSIPNVKLHKNQKIADYVLKHATSATTEALRTMMTILKLNQKRNNMDFKCLAVTSSLPGEGKSTLSAWLSRLSARTGKKTILVDCDLRRPNVHRLFELRNEETLAEYLNGGAELKDIIETDPETGLDMILGRSVANTALDLLSSKKMEELVLKLREEYDFVVLDTPASLAVSDSCLLAGYADHVIYAVHWDKTPRDIVQGGLKQFKDLGYQHLSLAFSLVDLKRQAKYGYGETAYYYSHYTEDDV